MAEPDVLPRACFPSFGAVGAPEVAAGPSASVLRERARREGRETGREQGRAEALAGAAPRLAAALRSLEQAAAALDAHRATLSEELAAALPRIVLALAERVVQREIAAEGAAALTTRVVAARLTRAVGPVTVRVSPAVAAVLTAAGGAEGEPPRVRVEGDATLGDSDWMLDTGDGLLDGRLATHFEEAARRLAEPEA